MLHRVMPEELQDIMPIFAHETETMILSCLQGFMGSAWTGSETPPRAAKIVVGDFTFFGGDASSNGAYELVSHLSEPDRRIHLFVPCSKEWEVLIEQAYPGIQKTIRYAIKKEPDVFDIGKLKRFLAELPPEYRIVQIGETLFDWSKQEFWACDFCSQFETYADFKRRGLGFMAIHKGRPVAGASSYSVYREGIEIEIDTMEPYRRKGLALACASALILACLEKGLYPSWDAANLASVRLSEKLGYRFDREYTAYDLYKAMLPNHI